MSVRGIAALSLVIMATPAIGMAAPAVGVVAPGAGTDDGLSPFAAHYQADWKTINVGTSDLELMDDAEPGRYVYTWTITAHGIFRMVYRDDLVQKSWFNVDVDHVKPMKYRAVDGSSSVDLDFDWGAGRVRGTSETKPVDVKVKEGTQDVMSIQVEVMLDLRMGICRRFFRSSTRIR